MLVHYLLNNMMNGSLNERKINMDIVMVKGRILSEEVKVLKTDRGIPLCYFRLSANNQIYHCLITGKQAYRFLFEAEKDTTLSLSAKVNNKGQLVVIQYTILQKPTYFGKIYNYKGHPLPLAKRSRA